MDKPTHPGLLALRHAVQNASTIPITDAAILGILRGEPAPGSHLRAVFGDASLHAILSAAAAADISRHAVLAAYQVARQSAAAANPELDAALSNYP
jgi:hypothetical protein